MNNDEEDLDIQEEDSVVHEEVIEEVEEKDLEEGEVSEGEEVSDAWFTVAIEAGVYILAD